MPEPARNLFPTSPGTLLLEARPALGQDSVADGDRWRLKLGELCALYRPSIVHWMKCQGAREQAEDIAHDFLFRWLAGNPLGDYRRGDHRFRDYLRVSLRNYWCEHVRWQLRQKRGGGVEHVEWTEADPVAVAEDAANLDRLLVRQMAGRVLGRLQGELVALPQPARQALLRSVLGVQEVHYPELARQLGVSVNAARLRVSRLRQSFLQQFRAEARALCRHSQEAEEEQRILIELLCREAAFFQAGEEGVAGGRGATRA